MTQPSSNRPQRARTAKRRKEEDCGGGGTQEKKLKKNHSDSDSRLPNHDWLTRAAEAESYHRALVLKRANQDHQLLELHRSLSLPISRSNMPSYKDRLTQVLRWKLLRGKYRAALPGLVAQNSGEDVQSVVQRCIDELTPCKTTHEAMNSKALSIMCELKGVGPATAAAFLSFEFPCLIPVFSDEAAWFFENSLGSIKYTLPYYKKYVDLLGSKAQELSRPGDSWDVDRLERALWTFKVLQDRLTSQEWNDFIDSPTVSLGS